MLGDVIYWELLMEISYFRKFVNSDLRFLEGRVERLRWEWYLISLEDYREIREWKSRL